VRPEHPLTLGNREVYGPHLFATSYDNLPIQHQSLVDVLNEIDPGLSLGTKALMRRRVPSHVIDVRDLAKLARRIANVAEG
jgi:hypothetical protein